MNFTHAESAILSGVIASPNGLPATIRKEGMPQFDLAAKEACIAIDGLKKSGLIRVFGPFYRLTQGGLTLLSDVVAEVEGKA